MDFVEILFHKIFAFKDFHYLRLPKKGGSSLFFRYKCIYGYFPSATARVAQLVEQLICNQLVGGSSPFSGSGKLNVRAGSRAAKWGGL